MAMLVAARMDLTSLPKNAEGSQPRIQGEIAPKNFGKKLYVIEKLSTALTRFE